MILTEEDIKKIERTRPLTLSIRVDEIEAELHDFLEPLFDSRQRRQSEETRWFRLVLERIIGTEFDPALTKGALTGAVNEVIRESSPAPWWQGIAQAWCKATSYDIWCVYDSVRSATLDAVRENLLELSQGDDDGSNVAEAAFRALERNIDNLVKNLK